MKKKALVIIYEGLSLSEINLLTCYLTVYQPEEECWVIDTVGAERVPYTSEDQFQVIPKLTFNEIDFTDYDIVILPGIINPYPVADDKRVIEFLKPLVTMKNRPLISAMSASPMLLAKAGLLKNVKFTSGLFEETLNEFDFFEKENIVREPIVYDKESQIITAINFAFREFAIMSAKLIGLEIEEDTFSGPRDNPPYEPEELTFYMHEENNPGEV